jgi:phage terminase small subunit
LKPPNKLNARQELFVAEFLIDGNATAAAKRAGYSAKTAHSIGERLLRHVEIAKAIASKQTKRLERVDVTAERVIAQLAATAFHDPLSAFDDHGNLRPLHEIDPATRSAMMIEIIDGFDGDGNPVQTRKTKFKDRDVSLDKLARHLGMFNDRLKISGDPESPIKILIDRINGQHSAIQPVIEGRVEDYDGRR